MNRFCGIPLLLTCAFHALSAAAPEPELQAVLEKHWDAMGGMRNWSKVESLRMSGTVERNGEVVDLVIVKKRPNQIRATVTVPVPGEGSGSIQVIRAHDGKIGWTGTRLPGAEHISKEELPPEAAAELLADAGVMPPLVRLWRSGADLTLSESVEFDGVDCFVVESRSNDGQTTTFHLSSDSFELLAYESPISAGGVQRTIIEDYTTLSGLKLPRTSIIETAATGRSVVTLHSFEIGVGIYDEYFNGSEPSSTTKR